jgi:hypothetical protein
MALGATLNALTDESIANQTKAASSSFRFSVDVMSQLLSSCFILDHRVARSATENCCQDKVLSEVV